MRLYHVHVSTKFEANRSINTVTVAKKPPKWTFFRHNVATSLRHDVDSHMVHCAYTMSMSPSNLNQIRRKTRPQWPKNRQNGRFYVITSRRRYVMTFFFTWYNAPIPCPCIHQIWSKSVEKHGHNREKRILEPSHCQPTSKFKNRAPSRHAPFPYLSCVQIWRRSVEKQKSLNIYKFGGGRGGRGHQPRSLL